MIEFRVEGLEEVERFIRNNPVASRRAQIGLTFGAARKLRREWQRERRAAAPRGQRRRGRLRGKLRGVRVWIPRSATRDTWPIINIVGPRHMVPTNARGGEYPGWLKLEDIGVTLAEQMGKDLDAWIRREARRR